MKKITWAKAAKAIRALGFRVSRDADGEICTVDLPEMHLDDLLVVGAMGAYSFSEATRFNGFEPPDFVFVD